jgi:hypothetical protein
MSGSVNSAYFGDYHVIMTDIPPQEISRITLAIYAKWLDFALGKTNLNGRMIVAPTGRYARSLQVRWEDGIAVGVIADANIAPEAALIEHGHAPVDLKTKLTHGRPYPMHRTTGLPGRIGGGPNGQRSSMWSQIRTRTFSGYASIGPNSPLDSWIIPAMPAYSPSLALAEMAAAMIRRGT